MAVVTYIITESNITVKCISIPDYLGKSVPGAHVINKIMGLTIGKSYDVIRTIESNNKMEYKIIDDTGRTNTYDKKYFMDIKEERDNKINTILK